MADVVIVTSPGNPDEVPEHELVRKLKKFLKWLPFGVGERLVALYLAMQDPLTPWSHKTIIAGALAYFILPFDVVPDWLGLIGMLDDAAVVTAAWKACREAVKDSHLVAARTWLGHKGLEGATP